VNVFDEIRERLANHSGALMLVVDAVTIVDQVEATRPRPRDNGRAREAGHEPFTVADPALTAPPPSWPPPHSSAELEAKRISEGLNLSVQLHDATLAKMQAEAERDALLGALAHYADEHHDMNLRAHVAAALKSARKG